MTGAEPHHDGRDPMARKNEKIDRERYLLLKGMLEDRRRDPLDHGVDVGGRGEAGRHAGRGSEGDGAGGKVR